MAVQVINLIGESIMKRVILILFLSFVILSCKKEEVKKSSLNEREEIAMEFSKAAKKSQFEKKSAKLPSGIQMNRQVEVLNSPSKDFSGKPLYNVKKPSRSKGVYSRRSIGSSVKSVGAVMGSLGSDQFGSGVARGGGVGIAKSYANHYTPPVSNESYDHIGESDFKSPSNTPLSTFSIDVDTASYSNMRRFINRNTAPPADAVRIEELINYFSYSYNKPAGKHPFAVTSEYSECPWNKNHKLLQIGLKGKQINKKSLPPSNLVLLIDVSGSMRSPNKLPLLKKGVKLLVSQLREQDTVSMVVYAGAAGVVLPPTSGVNKRVILDALYRLRSGGSTAGAAGINLAYKIAQENFMKKGNNRVILATDGDFNVGVSSNGALTRMVEKKREKGVFLTVLGFGMGNYKDSKMEQLADKGNGNYAYIDNLLEAKKVLVKQMGGTLFTIAKDVKIQVEFNPSKVKGYRLVGYENRRLKKEDFNNDKKDAGELGAGHTVTALYEIIPADSKEIIPSVDELKYQTTKVLDSDFGEVATVKLRYKPVKQSKSVLMKTIIKDDSFVRFDAASTNIKFASAVAQFGLLLTQSRHKEQANYDSVLKIVKESRGRDENGYRAEFQQLVEKVMLMNN